ncbi:carbohydrate-binding module family 13 protein [Trametes coccinea BRFM310]|uniref:Carbohydrate-binding module family 13 protein n=1 Tax=Trametes coccinea (strain BRFM310) TaxID=1353009 RepID=A0A1Y2I5Q6_TRAC3|nr:carbohydrate-binding module family 13 protein [Trametes coccinea BRFM310]
MRRATHGVRPAERTYSAGPAVLNRPLALESQMPYLHSLSIRLRGNHPTDKSTTSSTSSSTAPSHNIKHLFRSISKSTHRPRPTASMGNAPSDMNSPRQRAAQLARSATDVESVRSARAMPGAEPPTPIPESSTDGERPPSPSRQLGRQEEIDQAPKNSQVNEHAVSVQREEDIGDGPDLEAGPIPPITSFETEEETPAEQEVGQEPLLEQPRESEDRAAADVTRTPRAAVKSEETLAPTHEEHRSTTPSHHEHPAVDHAPEPSDATAVSTGSDAGTTPGGVWTPGTYVLLNARSGTAVDMSGADNKTLIGYPMHGGPNQQWEFLPSGHGYIIRCVRRSKDGHPLYLTTDGGVHEHAAIVASPYPVSWNVEQTEEGIRISWPNTDLVFDLADWGSKTPGTKIELMHLKPGEPCQLWHYTRCAPAAEHDSELEVRSSRAVSPPATTETVSVTEERDYITTTRTTTTTTITTTTEITKMPRWMLQHARPKSPNRRSIGYRLA